MARMSELKLELFKRPEGVVRGNITSVGKEIEHLLRNACEYEDRYLKYLERCGDIRELMLTINSIGGALNSAFGLLHAIYRINPPKGRILIDGQCGSAATVIPCGLKGANTPVYITPGGSVYIHMPKTLRYQKKCGLWSFIGNAQVSVSTGMMVKLYKHGTGRKESVIKAWMEEGKRFSAKEAVEAGFCDGIMTRAEFDKVGIS